MNVVDHLRKKARKKRGGLEWEGKKKKRYLASFGRGPTTSKFLFSKRSTVLNKSVVRSPSDVQAFRYSWMFSCRQSKGHLSVSRFSFLFLQCSMFKREEGNGKNERYHLLVCDVSHINFRDCAWPNGINQLTQYHSWLQCDCNWLSFRELDLDNVLIQKERRKRERGGEEKGDSTRHDKFGFEKRGSSNLDPLFCLPLKNRVILEQLHGLHVVLQTGDIRGGPEGCLWRRCDTREGHLLNCGHPRNPKLLHFKGLRFQLLYKLTALHHGLQRALVLLVDLIQAIHVPQNHEHPFALKEINGGELFTLRDSKLRANLQVGIDVFLPKNNNNNNKRRRRSWIQRRRRRRRRSQTICLNAMVEFVFTFLINPGQRLFASLSFRN